MSGGHFFTVNLLERRQTLLVDQIAQLVGRIGSEAVIRRYVWQDGGLRLRLQSALQTLSGLRI